MVIEFFYEGDGMHRDASSVFTFGRKFLVWDTTSGELSETLHGVGVVMKDYADHEERVLAQLTIVRRCTETGRLQLSDSTVYIQFAWFLGTVPGKRAVFCEDDEYAGYGDILWSRLLDEEHTLDTLRYMSPGRRTLATFKSELERSQ